MRWSVLDPVASLWNSAPSLIAPMSTHPEARWWLIPEILVVFLFTPILPVFYFALYRNIGSLRISRGHRMIGARRGDRSRYRCGNVGAGVDQITRPFFDNFEDGRLANRWLRRLDSRGGRQDEATNITFTTTILPGTELIIESQGPDATLSTGSAQLFSDGGDRIPDFPLCSLRAGSVRSAANGNGRLSCAPLRRDYGTHDWHRVGERCSGERAHRDGHSRR